MKFLIVLLSLHAVYSAPDFNSIVTPELKASLSNGATEHIFITLNVGTEPVLRTVTTLSFPDRASRLEHLHSALVKHASKTQAPILEFLSSQESEVDIQSFWITNQIYIKNADFNLVTSLVSKFPVLISKIDKEIHIQLDAPTSIGEPQQEENWAFEKIQVPQAWEELGGRDNAGEGVVVATIATGVRGSHEALRDNFAGEYGWFDPSGASSTPSDTNGFGTHTTGIIIGGGPREIGVAPKAQWASCRGCATSSCSQAHLLACGQFVNCPTLVDGSGADCSKAPHLVSCAWGAGSGDTFFHPVIEAWTTAGIIPLFAAGGGTTCGSIGSPGDHPMIIASGATTVDDAIGASGFGPTTDGRIKPEIVAPGSTILSAWYTADDAYFSLSGSSFACSFTSGTVALLKTRNANLTFAETSALLFENTDQDLSFSGRECGDIPDDVFPNNVFGHGRLNAFKAVQAQSGFSV